MNALRVINGKKNLQRNPILYSVIQKSEFMCLFTFPRDSISGN